MFMLIEIFDLAVLRTPFLLLDFAQSQCFSKEKTVTCNVALLLGFFK